MTTMLNTIWDRLGKSPFEIPKNCYKGLTNESKASGDHSDHHTSNEIVFADQIRLSVCLTCVSES